MTAHEKRLVRRTERFCRVNEFLHDQTRQRKFERCFLSLDCLDANGDPRDYGDCGRAARRMFFALDARYRELVRERRFAAALDALDGNPELQRTLNAIRRHRKRGRIAAALGVSPEAYAKRFARICRILGAVL